MKLKFFLICLTVLLAFYQGHAQRKSKTPYLLVLSMDGFRWDYIDSFPTPNFHRLVAKGVKAKSLIPSFPSVTFPNHYTMATGLYPDHHGIVHNSFYDSTLHTTYRLGDRKTVEDGRFYGGEPIWVSAENQNVRAASFYWVGSEAQGMHPTYWKQYDKKVTFEQRIDTVIQWLTLPENNRPHLVMFYYDQPDKVSHETGPFSPETRAMVMRMDTLAGIFLDKIEKLSIHNQLNVIFTSDHGMGEISNIRKIILDDYIKKEWCLRITGHNPVFMLDAKAGCTDSIFGILTAVPHMKVWKKHNVPSQLHFGSNARIGELIVLADSAYALGWQGDKTENAGAHGYDPVNTDMHGIFFASGPAFKKGYLTSSFENIHLYSIFASTLHLKPAPNDGNINQVKDIFIGYKPK